MMKILYFALAAVLGNVGLLAQAASGSKSKFVTRDLEPLTPSELAVLATTPDPSRNLDLSISTSHLSKILIPRARRCIISSADNTASYQ